MFKYLIRQSWFTIYSIPCLLFFIRFAEAEKLLAGTILTKMKSHEDIESEFGSMACYVFAQLGFIYR